LLSCKFFSPRVAHVLLTFRKQKKRNLGMTSPPSPDIYLTYETCVEFGKDVLAAVIEQKPRLQIIKHKCARKPERLYTQLIPAIEFIQMEVLASYGFDVDCGMLDGVAKSMEHWREHSIASDEFKHTCDLYIAECAELNNFKDMSLEENESEEENEDEEEEENEDEEEEENEDEKEQEDEKDANEGEKINEKRETEEDDDSTEEEEDENTQSRKKRVTFHEA